MEDYLGRSRSPMPDEVVTEKFLAQASDVLTVPEAKSWAGRLWRFESVANISNVLRISPIRKEAEL